MSASISYTTTGKTLKQDTELAFRPNTGIATHDSSFDPINKGFLRDAIVAAGKALEVDKNGTHSSAYTVTASVASTSVSIYIG